MIDTLLAAGYTLDQIADSLDTTIRELRQKTPTLPLCPATLTAMAEDLENGFTQKQTCRRYAVDLAKFKAAYYTYQATPPAETVAMLLREGLTHQEVKAELKCKAGDIKEELHRYVLELLATRKYTQEEIATMTGMSRASVSQLNPNRKPANTGNRLTPSQWDQVMQDIKTTSNMSEIARKHGITRTAIYNHLRRNHAETKLAGME
jgi:DNA-binding CsgD family transcriptional regulator